MAELDLGAHLREVTEGIYHRLVNDLNALDEDKAVSSPNPATRPAAFASLQHRFPEFVKSVE